MNRVLLSLTLCFLLDPKSNAQASSFELQPGDVILIHLSCYLCEVIARDGGEGYSHSGVVISGGNGDEALIGQSISKTEAIQLDDFLSQAKKGTVAAVYRPKELLNATIATQKKLGMQLTQTFFGSFQGTGFDKEFLWDNFDSRGRELMYCSEMITKLLGTVLRQPLLPEPMHFSEKYFEFWNQYFQKNIPEGKLGTSPGTFIRSKLFEKVATAQLP